MFPNPFFFSFFPLWVSNFMLGSIFFLMMWHSSRFLLLLLLPFMHRISNNLSYHWHLSHFCEHLSRYGRKFPPRLWFLCHCPVFLFYFRRSYPITIIYSRQIYTFIGFPSTSATCAPEWKEGILFSRFWCYWLCLFISQFTTNVCFVWIFVIPLSAPFTLISPHVYF